MRSKKRDRGQSVKGVNENRRVYFEEERFVNIFHYYIYYIYNIYNNNFGTKLEWGEVLLDTFDTLTPKTGVLSDLNMNKKAVSTDWEA